VFVPYVNTPSAFVLCYFLAMSAQITPLALGGVIASVVCLIRSSPQSQKRRRLLAILSLYLYVLEALFPYIHELQSLQYGGYGARGPYGIMKSNALKIMRHHDNDRWFRQFFRYVYIFVLCNSLTHDLPVVVVTLSYGLSYLYGITLFFSQLVGSRNGLLGINSLSSCIISVKGLMAITSVQLVNAEWPLAQSISILIGSSSL
jgi:hypothetical protein